MMEVQIAGLIQMEEVTIRAEIIPETERVDLMVVIIIMVVMMEVAVRTIMSRQSVSHQKTCSLGK